ncbi:gamma-glutamyl kinase, partial [Streptococcus agalactiae]
MKRHFETTRRIVIKVGTSSLVQTSGKINLSKIDH